MLLKKAVVVGLLLMTVLLLPLCAQGKETLAVLDFTTEAVSEIEMKAIVEFLSAELFKTDKYTVIDVSQRETILKEMEFSLQGCSDETCALEIGKMLSAEMIVTGNLSKVGSRYLMSVKMLETETSRTTGTANGKFRDLDELIDGLELIAYDLAGMDTPAAAVAESQPETESEPEPAVEPEPEPAVEIAETTDSGEDEQAAADDGGPAQTARDAAVSVEAGNERRSAVPAIICTAGGVAAMGTGGFFLYQLFADSLPVYREAKSAYDMAYGDETDYTALYDASVEAYDDAFFDFILGASIAGAGVILTTVGIILFPPKADKDGATVSFAPVISNNPGMVVRVSY